MIPPSPRASLLGATPIRLALVAVLLAIVAASCSSTDGADAEEGSAPRGRLVDAEIPGPQSGLRPRPAIVYLPPGYDEASNAADDYPVLYMLHGAGADESQWVDLEIGAAIDDLIAAGGIEPLIVVMPTFKDADGVETECQNIPDGPQAETYLTEDVVEFIDETYRTSAVREQRAIGGLSTGGFCAIDLTLRHQDTYSAFVSHSGAAEPDTDALETELDIETTREYVDEIPISEPVCGYLDVGADDPFPEQIEGSTLIFEELRERGLSITFHIWLDEGHDGEAWARNLSVSLPWVSAWFEDPPTTPPIPSRSDIDVPEPEPAPPDPAWI